MDEKIQIVDIVILISRTPNDPDKVKLGLAQNFFRFLGQNVRAGIRSCSFSKIYRSVIRIVRSQIEHIAVDKTDGKCSSFDQAAKRLAGPF